MKLSELMCEIARIISKDGDMSVLHGVADGKVLPAGIKLTVVTLQEDGGKMAILGKS